MSLEQERDIRAKGVNFIVQVGIMLKLPQLTLSTAAIFFQRFLMRASLKKERNSIPKLHHFQSAAIAIFLATKVEESSRKMKDMVLAFCRVAQKNPNLIVDEQSKDFWKWRDLILHHEDVLLETLCFDLTVESPHRQLFEMLKYYGIEHNKRLRNAAWAFVTDSANTQLCLLQSSRTIAVAGLYAACKLCDVTIPDDSKGRPWWEAHHVRLKDVRKAVEYMLFNYDPASSKIGGVTASGGSEGNGSTYMGLSTPNDAAGAANDGWDSTRHRPQSVSPFPTGSERRNSNASSIVMKRDRDEAFESKPNQNGSSGEQDNKRQRVSEGAGPNHHKTVTNNDTTAPAAPPENPQAENDDPKEQEEALRVANGNKQADLAVRAEEKAAAQKVAASHTITKPNSAEEGEVSEEGEVEG